MSIIAHFGIPYGVDVFKIDGDTVEPIGHYDHSNMINAASELMNVAHIYSAKKIILMGAKDLLNPIAENMTQLVYSNNEDIKIEVV